MKKIFNLKATETTTAILLGTVATALMATTTNLQVTKVATHIYSQPCSAGDVQDGQSCCPQGTQYVYHNMCMNAEEYQQSQQGSANTGRCVMNHAFGGLSNNDPGQVLGGFGCLTHNQR